MDQPLAREAAAAMGGLYDLCSDAISALSRHGQGQTSPEQAISEMFNIFDVAPAAHALRRAHAVQARLRSFADLAE